MNYDFNAPNFTFLSENAIHLSGSIVKVGKETPKKQYVEPSKEDILQNFPKHIQYKTLENKGNFEGNLDFFNRFLIESFWFFVARNKRRQE